MSVKDLEQATICGGDMMEYQSPSRIFGVQNPATIEPEHYTLHKTKNKLTTKNANKKTSPHQSKDSTTFSTYQTTQNHNRMNNVRFIFNFSFHILRLKQTNHFHTLKLPPPQKMRHADTSTTKIYFRNPHHTIFNRSSRIQPSG